MHIEVGYFNFLLLVNFLFCFFVSVFFQLTFLVIKLYGLEKFDLVCELLSNS